MNTLDYHAYWTYQLQPEEPTMSKTFEELIAKHHGEEVEFSNAELIESLLAWHRAALKSRDVNSVLAIARWIDRQHEHGNQVLGEDIVHHMAEILPPIEEGEAT